MKVLLIATGVFLKGGIERYTRYQYKALQESYGNENVILASLLGGELDNSFEEEIEVEYVQGGIGLVDKVRFVFKCLQLIRKKKIELVICNHRQLSIIGYLGQVLFKVAYITNVYGLEIWSGMNKVEKNALLSSSSLIGDCNFILKYINENYNYRYSQMDLLYDAVDIDKFRPESKNIALLKKYGIPEGRFIIATIGRLERNKGHQLIIKTLKELPESIVYLIVGGGSTMNSLETLVKELELDDRVIFTDRVPENELVSLYNISDIVILLSVFGKNEGEGLPLGLIEASACGKPIICGNEDGSQDAISEDLPNGRLINPRSQQELKDAINSYLENSEELQSHGANGRRFVTENFDYEIFRKRQEEIIKSLDIGIG